MGTTEEIRQLFGKRVRQFRQARRWQLDDLAMRLGKSRASVSRIETGKQNLSIEDIGAIAQALEVSIAELFVSGAVAAQGRAGADVGQTLEECRQAVETLQRLIAQLTAVDETPDRTVNAKRAIVAQFMPGSLTPLLSCRPVAALL